MGLLNTVFSIFKARSTRGMYNRASAVSGMELEDILCKLYEEEYDGFRFYGKGKRSKLKEMRGIDKISAERAFSNGMCRVIEPYLTSYKFIKMDEITYVRLNDIDIIEIVYFQKNEKECLVAPCLLLVPLYMRNNFFGITRFAVRLATLINQTEFWWDYKDEETAINSFKNIVDGIEKFAHKWFNRYNDLNRFVDDLHLDAYRTLHYGVAWNAHLVIKDGDKKVIDHFFRFGWRFYKWRAHIAYGGAVKKMRKEMEALSDKIYNPKLFIEKNIRANIDEYGLPKSFIRKYKYCVGNKEYEIEDILPILLFYDLVIRELENKQRGSKYPVLMATLYNGLMLNKDAEALEQELLRLQDDLNKLAEENVEVENFLKRNNVSELLISLVRIATKDGNDIALIKTILEGLDRSEIQDKEKVYKVGVYRLP